MICFKFLEQIAQNNQQRKYKTSEKRILFISTGKLSTNLKIMNYDAGL